MKPHEVYIMVFIIVVITCAANTLLRNKEDK